MAFRRGDAAAFAPVLDAVRAAVERGTPDLAGDEVVVAAMPGHLPGTVHAPLERLAGALAAEHRGWRHGRGLLTRVAAAPSGREASERDPAAEAATLRWASVQSAASVLLLDDVVRTGASLEAAWQAAPPELRERILAVAAFRAEG